MEFAEDLYHTMFLKFVKYFLKLRHFVELLQKVKLAKRTGKKIWLK